MEEEVSWYLTLVDKSGSHKVEFRWDPGIGGFQVDNDRVEQHITGDVETFDKFAAWAIDCATYLRDDCGWQYVYISREHLRADPAGN